MTNHNATAERLADLADHWAYGDRSGSTEAHTAATALAAEGLVHAVLALTAEIREWRSDQRIDTPPLVVYRAAHESVGLGLYTNRDAARDHCVASARESGLTNLAWVTEADDDTDNLHDAENARETGYSVHPVDVPDEHDSDAE